MPDTNMLHRVSECIIAFILTVIQLNLSYIFQFLCLDSKVHFLGPILPIGLFNIWDWAGDPVLLAETPVRGFSIYANNVYFVSWTHFRLTPYENRAGAHDFHKKLICQGQPQLFT